MQKSAIFWCGSILNYNGLKLYKGETPAATQWSRGLMHGLQKNGLDVTGFAPIWDSNFPKGKLFPSNAAYLDDSIRQIPVNYVNLPKIRTASIAGSLARQIEKQLKISKEAPLAILNYNTYPHYCQALKTVVKKYPEVNWVNIVLDLDDPTEDNWKRFLEDTEGSKGSVFLSWWGYENAPIKNKLHLDGGWDGELPAADSPDSNKEKIFIYAGKLADYGGINEIIAAIKELKAPDVFFDFYGKGSSPALNELAAADQRVRIRGFVSDAELDEACRTAMSFLSPRDINFHGTRMIFPSKLLFYLKYQQPVLAPMLPGVADDYKYVLLPPADSSAKAWADAMQQVLDMSQAEKEQRRDRIKQFITNKSWFHQGARLADFLKSL